MVINAKFKSVCPVCSQPIKVGEKVEWVKGESARHKDCYSKTPEMIIQPLSLRHPAFEFLFIEERMDRFHFKRIKKWKFVHGLNEDDEYVVLDKVEEDIDKQTVYYFSTDKCGNNVFGQHDEDRIVELKKQIQEHRGKQYDRWDPRGSTILNSILEIEKLEAKRNATASL